jgi:hypothetical protein
MSKIEVNTVAPQCGTTLTLGESGDTVTLGTGASQSGFGRTGTVNWVTTKKTTGFTAVSGEGYFCDTAASGAFTLTLPSSPSAGDIVGFKDYNGNFATANLTIGRGGSPINGGSSIDPVINTSGTSIFLVYVDASQGWVATQDDSSSLSGSSFITATGGTVSEDGNFKVHTFTGPGTFTVCSLGSGPTGAKVDYVVIAGGGASGYDGGGGGGAGGYREGLNPGSYTASPLATTALTVSATGFPITIGGGGPSGPPSGPGVNGSNSIFSSITSAGGGGGHSSGNGLDGGSGGGAYRGAFTGGAGNTPPVSPPQGNTGGNGLPGPEGGSSAGGGGGATAAGTTATAPTAGPGGAGATSSINGAATARAGGGGGGADGPVPSGQTGGTGGAGGGGIGGKRCGPSNTAGTDNTGGGAGGGGAGGAAGKNGGSGIVIIRYKFQ